MAAPATDAPPGPALLVVEHLGVEYGAGASEIPVVSDLSFELAAGATLGIVGESGAGKTQAMLAVMGLLPPTARARGSVRFAGAELVGHPRRSARLRGRRMALVLQDPASALNPYLTIGAQLREVLAVHEQLRGSAARRRAVELLGAVQIAEAARRLDQYPHELSGGMRQRALIALALACRPALLIADEPTTALDVTVQAQLLALLESLRRDLQLGIIVVSHDLGVVARLCDAVLVLYAGRVIEHGTAAAVFHRAAHPYTRALLRAAPRLDTPRLRVLPALPGQVAPPSAHHPGCAFQPRCAQRLALCERERPALRGVAPDHRAACHLLA